MTIDKKLEVILNAGIPSKAGIFLKVDCCPVQVGDECCYGVRIIKHGKPLEMFYINLASVVRLTENIDLED